MMVGCVHIWKWKSIGIFFLGLNAVSFAAFAASFPDTVSHPYESSVNALALIHVVTGYDDSTFRPDKAVKRAEFAKMLVLSVGQEPDTEDARCFPDVSTEWFAQYICYAKRQGWVKGYDDGMFSPGQTVTLAEALKMTMIAFDYIPSQSSPSASIPGVEPGAWYAPYVLLASEQNMVQFAETFNPVAEMTRGAISDMVYRCMLKKKASAAPFELTQSSETSLHPSTSQSSPSPSRRRGGGGNAEDSGRRGGSNSVPLSSPSISFSDIAKNFGDVSFTLSPTSNSAGPFTFDSSDTNVATIVGSTVTIAGVGSTVITVTQAAAGNYAGGTKTATLTVNAIAPVITFNNITKNFGDANFALSPTSNSAGAFSYGSTNTNVATIAASTVTVVGAGTTTITLNQAANGNYLSGSTTATLTVSPIAPTLGGFSNIGKFVGDIPFSLTAPTTNSAGAFTYGSSVTGVATVGGNTVTIVSNGTTVITATQAANGNYTSGTRTLTLTVSPGGCYYGNFCENGGACTNLPGGDFSCACVAPWSGPVCTASNVNCAPGTLNQCLNGGTCEPDTNGGRCECNVGCFSGDQCDVPSCV